MNYLLDTNVISESVSKKPNADVLMWLRESDPRTMYLSVVTIGELVKGIHRLQPFKRRTRLEQWIQHDLMGQFSGQILPLDVKIMIVWGELVARLQKVGRVLPAMDSMIAATAIHHQMTLVTRNTKDFKAMGLVLFNPWQDDQGHC